MFMFYCVSVVACLCFDVFMYCYIHVCYVYVLICLCYVMFMSYYVYVLLCFCFLMMMLCYVYVCCVSVLLWFLLVKEKGIKNRPIGQHSRQGKERCVRMDSFVLYCVLLCSFNLLF